ncbi:hypothetical protein NLK61_02465 [Pseudomonas fuscovaginae UPB0736]|uniref:hypothetical protein n=1 Tax=Pseudomonas asplenii TaxID=53407 RepID=UPI0012F82550|nr:MULTISPECIES: hypothetical protein [Pseudomonas]UUQ65538.1 hypothetical protein NLK61_02465 [Pseudomonas fuscovaginae UPB0736]UZE31257.1 hypothetical protein LOY63_11215 [Pseudomonas asplenii]
MGKVKLIEALILAERFRDVLDLLEEESVYFSGKAPIVEQGRESRRLRIMAVHHLRFLAEFGSASSGCFEGKRYLTPFPQDFEAWLRTGAPEVALADLEALLADHPL